LATITDASGTKTFSYDKWRAVTKITNPDGTYQLFSTPDDQGIVDTSTGVGTQTNPAPLFYAAQVDGTQTDERVKRCQEPLIVDRRNRPRRPGSGFHLRPAEPANGRRVDGRIKGVRNLYIDARTEIG